MKLLALLVSLAVLVMLVDARNHFLRKGGKRTTLAAPTPTKPKVAQDIQVTTKRTTLAAPTPTKAPGQVAQDAQKATTLKRTTLAAPTPTPPRKYWIDTPQGAMRLEDAKRIYNL